MTVTKILEKVTTDVYIGHETATGKVSAVVMVHGFGFRLPIDGWSKEDWERLMASEGGPDAQEWAKHRGEIASFDPTLKKWVFLKAEGGITSDANAAPENAPAEEPGPATLTVTPVMRAPGEPKAECKKCHLPVVHPGRKYRLCLDCLIESLFSPDDRKKFEGD